MSGFVFKSNIQLAVVVVAVGKWESRGFGEISKSGGKVRFWTFPPDAFSTAAEVATMGVPWLV